MYKSGQNNSPTFNIWGYLVFENGQWFIEPYLEGLNLVMGNSDSYKVPDELVKDWKLDELLKAEQPSIVELAESFFKK